MAGGDINPYLLLSVILGAALYGIQTEMTPPHPIKGNSYEQDLPKFAPSCEAAINSFQHDQLIARIFSETLIENLCLTKQQELSVLADIKVTEHWQTFLEAV